MRFISFVFLLFVFTLVVNGQGTFTPINWGVFPSDYSYDENPYSKRVARVYKYSGGSLDFESVVIQDLWNSIEDEYMVNGGTDGEPPVYFDLDDEGNGTFGVTFKLLYDSDNLYFLARYIDTESRESDDHKALEVFFQTKYKERYEPGFQAASDLQEQNEQYGRFIELGGCNNVMQFSSGDAHWVQTWGSEGQTGNWTGHVVDEIPVRSLEDGSGTIWTLSAFSFSGNMYYLEDEWGDISDPENQVPFDPQVKDTIAFEVMANYAPGGETPTNRAWWCSTDNDVFKNNYYAGYLIFDEYKVSLPPDVPTDRIFLCVGEEAEPLVAYGENLKWYTDPESDEFSTTAPVPPTDQAGEQRYYVTQSPGGVESNPVEIIVTVYQLVSGLSDLSSDCEEELQLQSFVLNNQKKEELDYLWTSIPSGTTYTEEDPLVALEPIDGKMRMAWEVSSASGCLARDTIDIFFSPNMTPVRFRDATALQNNKGYQLTIDAPLDFAIDSVYLYKSNELSDSVFLEAFGEDDYPEIIYNTISCPGEHVAYYVESLDMCGNRGTTPDDWLWNWKQPSVLDTTRINGVIYDLSWNDFGGRKAETYQVFRRVGDGPEEIIGSTDPGINHFTVFQHSTDTLEFQLETRFDDSGTVLFDYYSARSLVLKLPPSDSDIVFDTVFIYDTVTVHQTVNDTIRIYQNMTVTDSLVIDVDLEDGAPGINVQQILVYPNPTVSYLVVEVVGEFRLTGYRLKIADTAARVVYDAEFTDPRIEIQMTDFGETGLYILEIFDDDGNIAYTGKIILR